MIPGGIGFPEGCDTGRKIRGKVSSFAPIFFVELGLRKRIFYAMTTKNKSLRLKLSPLILLFWDDNLSDKAIISNKENA